MKASKTQGGTLGDKKVPNPRGSLWVTKNCETTGGHFGDKPAQHKGGPWVTTNLKTKGRQLTYKTCKIKGAILGKEKSSKPKKDPWWQFPNSKRDPCMTKTCETKGGPFDEKNFRNQRGYPWVTKICENQEGPLGDKPVNLNGGPLGDQNLPNPRGNLCWQKTFQIQWGTVWWQKLVKPKRKRGD